MSAFLIGVANNFIAFKRTNACGKAQDGFTIEFRCSCNVHRDDSNLDGNRYLVIEALRNGRVVARLVS